MNRARVAFLARTGALILATSVTAEASADPRREPAMESALTRYFDGEMREGGVFLGVGAGTAFIAGAGASRDDFGIGVASAVLPVSLIQIVAGVVLLARTENQVAELVALHRRDSRAYRAKELPRMERVNFWFDVYKTVEVCLIAVGAASVVFGIADHRDGFTGAGAGLISQAGAMLAFDFFAAERARIYTQAIQRSTPIGF